MEKWEEKLKGDPLPWLLESDQTQPAVRFFTLRDILGIEAAAREVIEARAKIMTSGPVPAILAAQNPAGYWEKPGAGYGPKYTGTQWSLIFLAQLGADGTNPAVRGGCEYLLKHATSINGGFSMDGTPSGFIQCMAGNLGAALIDFGLGNDPRVEAALDWLARTVTGEGVAGASEKETSRRYYRSGNSGPNFACAGNTDMPCAWGAVKVMTALAKIPISRRTPQIESAVSQGINFLLSGDPAKADYPSPTGKANLSWFKFGYPLGYVTDVLQNLEALTALGEAKNPRLEKALELLLSKQDAQGRWKMEYTYNGKTWADIETKGKPSKWVTLRALRVLKAAYN
jgi:hypothetical protein